MAIRGDFYSILHVERTASTDEIRSAYLKLLKQHHPDRAADEAERERASRYSATLNVAFATLRDPLKRAAYDRRHPASQAVRVRHERADIQIGVHAPGMSVASLGQFLGAFSIAVVALVAGGIFLSGPQMRGWLAMNEAAPLGSVPANRFSANFVLQPDEVARTVRLASQLSMNRAADVSRNCFRQALSSSGPGATALCVIFDNAVVMSGARSRQNDLGSSYFRVQLIKARHLGALAPWGADNEHTLTRLRSVTLKSMLANIAPNTAPTPDPRLVEAAAAGVPPIVPPQEQNPVLGQPDQPVSPNASQLTQNKLSIPTQGD